VTFDRYTNDEIPREATISRCKLPGASPLEDIALQGDGLVEVDCGEMTDEECARLPRALQTFSSNTFVIDENNCADFCLHVLRETLQLPVSKEPGTLATPGAVARRLQAALDGKPRP